MAPGSPAAPVPSAIPTSSRLDRRAGKMSAVRLEVLPDDRLPHHGPGRWDNGNFHLTEFRLFAARRRRVRKVQNPSVFARATADYNEGPGISAAQAIDGKDQTHWGVDPQYGVPHQAVFEIKTPAIFAADTSVDGPDRKPGGSARARNRALPAYPPAMTLRRWRRSSRCRSNWRRFCACLLTNARRATTGVGAGDVAGKQNHRAQHALPRAAACLCGDAGFPGGRPQLQAGARTPSDPHSGPRRTGQAGRTHRSRHTRVRSGNDGELDVGRCR